MEYTILLQASQIKTITLRLIHFYYFLTYLLDWYLLNISGTYTPVSLCRTYTLHTHRFLAVCSTLVSLWSFPL